MNRLVIRRHNNWYILLAAVLSFFAMVATASIQDVRAAEETRQSGERLLTVHERGEERVFLTSATTVGEALELAGIEVSETDTVEPAKDEELIASDYNVNIYRTRPVIVVDGASRQKVMTSRQTPAQIAESAGIDLHPEDESKLGMPADMLGDGAGLELTISRATELTLVLYGKEAEIRTQAETVGELLDEKDIELGPNDKMSVDKSEPIVAGMKLELWREGKQTITEEEDVDFEVQQIRDADRPAGYREVKTPGVKGKRTVTYEIVIKNGKEIERKEVASVTTKQPKKQVEVIGVKVEGPESIMAKIREASEAKGIDSQRVLLIAKCESGFNPRADSGYYKGIFQHDPGYWPARAAKYGYAGASYFDVDAQIGVSTSMMAGGGWGHWGCDPGPQ